MKRLLKRKGIFLAFVAAAFLPLFASAAPQRGDVVLSGGPVFTPIIGGGFDVGDKSPNYSDVFKSGLGIGMDGMIVATNWLRAGFGFSTSVFMGDKLGGESVKRLWLPTLMVGAQFFPLKVTDERKIAPYLRADLGMAIFSGVALNDDPGGNNTKLFRTTAAWAGDVGVGAEWWFKSNWAIFGDLRYMMTGNPYGAGDLKVHNTQPVSYLPIRFGVVYVY